MSEMKKICELHMTVMDLGDETQATDSIEFSGNGMDKAMVLAHLFSQLHISREDLPLVLEALRKSGDEESKNDGVE